MQTQQRPQGKNFFKKSSDQLADAEKQRAEITELSTVDDELTEKEIITGLSKMKMHKACGLDGLVYKRVSIYASKCESICCKQSGRTNTSQLTLRTKAVAIHHDLQKQEIPQ